MKPGEQKQLGLEMFVEFGKGWGMGCWLWTWAWNLGQMMITYCCWRGKSEREERLANSLSKHTIFWNDKHSSLMLTLYRTLLTPPFVREVGRIVNVSGDVNPCTDEKAHRNNVRKESRAMSILKVTKSV